MKKKQIDLFFSALDQALGERATVILTGAGAGALLGHARPSLDIDFEIRLKNPTRKAKGRLQDVVEKVAYQMGIAVSYSEDISRWSMVSYLGYRKTAIAYKKFGKLEVKVMAPEYWTIGKMARFYELDIQDMIRIIRKKRLKPERLLGLWRRVIRESSLSLELGQFKKHVVYFLRTYGRRLWGRSFQPGRLLKKLDKIAS